MSPDWTWVLTAVVGLVTYFLVRKLIQIRSLPPGPFPLPILGNLLALRGEGNELPRVLMRMQEKYKDMFTLWMGMKPSIIVCTWELCHDALITKKNDFSGRVSRPTFETILGENTDVAISDFSPAQETLRKVLSAAVRKYVLSVQLAELVSDVVDRTTDTMLKENKPVDSSTFMYLNVYNILASSAFGVRFELDDPVFIKLKATNDELNEKFGNGLPSDALPFLKFFYKKRLNELLDLIHQMRSYIVQKVDEHKETYQSGDIRDFTDAVLAAREEAAAEGKDSLQHLTDGNIHMLLMTLFSAGTDTSRVFLLWLFLIISNYPEIQRKMQEEIDKQIGSRQPLQKDKETCPYVHAVMTEILRYRNVLDITLEHKTVFDTELGGYKIPKDTSVIFYTMASHFNPDYWEEPNKFKPERFLDADGNYTSKRISNYLPFGLGRRSCPGEKLALADVFLITARLLQKHNFSLEGGPGSGKLDKTYQQVANFPTPFKLVITKRDVNN